MNEENQQLEIDIPSTSSGDAFYSGYSSQFRIRGDFDVEVSYKLIEWPATSGVRIGMIARSSSAFSFALERVSGGSIESIGDV